MCLNRIVLKISGGWRITMHDLDKAMHLLYIDSQPKFMEK